MDDICNLHEIFSAGFAKIDAFATRTELKELRAKIFVALRRCMEKQSSLLVRLDSQSEGSAGVFQLQRASFFLPELRSHPVFLRMKELALHILGESAVYTWDSVILKSALGDSGTPWHQDAAFDSRAGHPWYVPYGLSFWLPLTRHSEFSGCLAYVPRTHHGEIQSHEIVGGTRFFEVDLNRFRVIRRITDPGCLLLHHPKTWHKSMPNKSKHARVAWSVNFDA